MCEGKARKKKTSRNILKAKVSFGLFPCKHSWLGGKQGIKQYCGNYVKRAGWLPCVPCHVRFTPLIPKKKHSAMIWCLRCDDIGYVTCLKQATNDKAQYNDTGPVQCGTKVANGKQRTRGKSHGQSHPAHWPKLWPEGTPLNITWKYPCAKHKSTHHSFCHLSELEQLQFWSESEPSHCY